MNEKIRDEYTIFMMDDMKIAKVVGLRRFKVSVTANHIMLEAFLNTVMAVVRWKRFILEHCDDRSAVETIHS